MLLVCSKAVSSVLAGIALTASLFMGPDWFAGRVPTSFGEGSNPSGSTTFNNNPDQCANTDRG